MSSIAQRARAAQIPINRKAIAHTVTAAIKAQIPKAIQRIEAATADMLADAQTVLSQASLVGPLITQNLERHARRERLTIDDLDNLSKIWERMLLNSRKVLGMDKDTQNPGSIRIGVFLACPRPADPSPDKPIDDV